MPMWCERCSKKIDETGHVCFDRQPQFDEKVGVFCDKCNELRSFSGTHCMNPSCPKNMSYDLYDPIQEIRSLCLSEIKQADDEIAKPITALSPKEIKCIALGAKEMAEQILKKIGG